MSCTNCGKSVEDGSRFCRHCGATQPIILTEPAIGAVPSKGIPKTALWLIGGVFTVAVVANLGPSEPNNTTSTSAAEATADQVEAEADRLEKLADAPKPVENWSYSTDVDKVRGARSYEASTISTNQIQQASPYGGGTSMTITVRKHPGWGTDVILRITEGQMMCPSYEGCSALASFDGGKPHRIGLNGPSDNSSEVVFVSGAQSFITKLKRSKTVAIEKTLYQAGAAQFEFNVAGLKDFSSVFDNKGNMNVTAVNVSKAKCDPKLAGSVGLNCKK